MLNGTFLKICRRESVLVLVHPKECSDFIESDKTIYSNLSSGGQKLILLRASLAGSACVWRKPAVILEDVWWEIFVWQVVRVLWFFSEPFPTVAARFYFHFKSSEKGFHRRTWTLNTIALESQAYGLVSDFHLKQAHWYKSQPNLLLRKNRDAVWMAWTPSPWQH